ncbi:unnamed protein product [Cuscuta campestris]|uniref:Uncharacterized protein n=1 Tax=Cuscuta campestris TaxID=132261 RepID=A0A484KT61_9ASTE|nr:unnamed protein product [Cuscuta campestris]
MYHDEDIPLDDTIIHPSNAEAKIWAIQDIHKRTASHLHLAKLWRSDLRHHAFVDPKLQTLSNTKAKPRGEIVKEEIRPLQLTPSRRK